MALSTTEIDRVTGTLTSAASGAPQTVLSYAVGTNEAVVLRASLTCLQTSPNPDRACYILQQGGADFSGTLALNGSLDKLEFETGGAIPWDASLSVSGNNINVEFTDGIGQTVEVFAVLEVVKAAL